MNTVYRIYNAQGRLLYVGVTDCMTQRLKGHLRRSPWIDEAAVITIEQSPNAQRAELEAIRSEWPLYNVVGAPLGKVASQARARAARGRPANARFLAGAARAYLCLLGQLPESYLRRGDSDRRYAQLLDERMLTEQRQGGGADVA